MKKLLLLIFFVISLFLVGCDNKTSTDNPVDDENKTNQTEEFVLKYYVNDELFKEEKYEKGTSVNLLDISNEYEDFLYWVDKNNEKLNDSLIIEKDLDAYAVFKEEKEEFVLKYFVDGELYKEEKYEKGTSVNLLDISNEYDVFKYWVDKDNNKIDSPLVIDNDLEAYADFGDERYVIIIRPLQGESYFKLHPLCFGEPLKIDAVIKPATAYKYPYRIIWASVSEANDCLEIVDDCYIKVKEGKEIETIGFFSFSYRLQLYSDEFSEGGWVSLPNRIRDSVGGFAYDSNGEYKSIIGKPTLSNEEYSPETGKLVLHDGDKFGLLFYEILDGKFVEANLDEITVGVINYEITEGTGFTIDSNGVVSTNLESVTDFKVKIWCEITFEVYDDVEEKNIEVTTAYSIELS